MLFANKSFSIFKHLRRFCSSNFCSSYSDLLIGNDPAALATALKLSANSKSYALGIQIHGHVVKSGLSDNTFVQNNLIRTYTKCGVFHDGLKVFDEMFDRNLVSWTLLISGAIQDGEFELGLSVYLKMTRAGWRPNEFALGSVMKACIVLGANDFGLCIHCLALKIGMEKNQFVASSVLHMYAMSGDIESAELVFECVDDLDIGCWNAMIGAYVQCGRAVEAAEIMYLMYCDGITMDDFTFINAFKGCLTLSDLNYGKEIHGLIIKNKFELSACVTNSLIDMYFKNGRKGSAWNVFNMMQNKDAISWNTVFSGFSYDGDSKEVADLFRELLSTPLKPNKVTFSILFRHCGEALHVNLGLQLFSLALQFGFSNESKVVSSIIFMFSRCGEMKMACLVFDTVPFKGVIIWNEMISGYNFNCWSAEAMKLFHNLWESGAAANECTFSLILEVCSKSKNQRIGKKIFGVIVKNGFFGNKFLRSSLIKNYVRFGLLDDCFELFNGHERLDLGSWGTLFSELVHQGYHIEAIKLTSFLMEAGEKPDEFILGSILNACAVTAFHHQTKSVHSLVIKMGLEMNVFVASAAVDAYAKSGDIESARMAFEQTSRSDDVVLFNTMIMAYAHHGLVMNAVEIFNRMKLANLKPSQTTFVSVISACNYLGEVHLGLFFFESISSNYGMEPSQDNYGCLIDMFSRNGFLKDAKCVIDEMPFSPWPAVWRSLLNGCRIHGDRELGELAAHKLVQLVPQSDAAFMLLSRLYSEEGSWDNAAKMRKRMLERGIKKTPGCSWIEL